MTGDQRPPSLARTKRTGLVAIAVVLVGTVAIAPAVPADSTHQGAEVTRLQCTDVEECVDVLDECDRIREDCYPEMAEFVDTVYEQVKKGIVDECAKGEDCSPTEWVDRVYCLIFEDHDCPGTNSGAAELR